jgi:hypothetical protein
MLGQYSEECSNRGARAAGAESASMPALKMITKGLLVTCNC